MDIEKLIKRYHNLANRWENGEQLLLDGTMRIQDELRDAATALSALKAENERLRACNTKLEDTVRSQRNGLQELRAELSQMSSCIYYKQGGLCRYGADDPANVCVMGPCDHEVSAQQVLAELEQAKAVRKR